MIRDWQFKSNILPVKPNENTWGWPVVLVACFGEFRVAKWPPVWKGAVRSVCRACLSWAAVDLCIWLFPFWFWERDVGSDCISSWSLLIFLLSPTCYFLKQNSLFKRIFGHKVFICKPIFEMSAAHFMTNLELIVVGKNTSPPAK